jgi:hypothetical protein
MSVGDDDVKVGGVGLNFFSSSLGCYYRLRFFVRFNSDRVLATKIQKRPSQNRGSGVYHGITLRNDDQSRAFYSLPCCVTPTTAAHPDFQLRSRVRRNKVAWGDNENLPLGPKRIPTAINPNKSLNKLSS